MIRCLNCMKEFDEQYGVCPNCGHVPETQPKEAYQLSQGVVLAKRYIIGTAVGVGGFGITYKAWDQTLQKMIAIKEYYPSANGIVNRTPGNAEVIIYSGDRAVEFEKGKGRFLAEARNMAKFNTHPNIVHVYDFFEENKTAYIAMEFLDGVSYKQYIAANGGVVEQSVALEVTLSVLDALKEIHKSGIIHRDISPDNIFICQGGIIKLIDFGAARFSTGEEEKTLSVILKPGYAPPEQYRSRSRQGPWTDIYAVGAMFYRAITGKMPEESVNRMVQDNVVPPHQMNPEISENLSNSIMRAMALNQELRFRNVDQFKDAIQSKVKVADVDTELKKRKKFRFAIVGAVFSVLIVAGGLCFTAFMNKRGQAALSDASIVVWYPVNEGEGPDLLQMAASYQQYYPNIEIKAEPIPEDQYEERLREALATGNMPTVFDSSCLGSEDFGEMASLDEVYDWLDDRDELERYYFLDKHQQYFPEAKQLPLSFQAPVIYVNTRLVENAPDHVSSPEDMERIIESDAGYAVSQDGDAAFKAIVPEVSTGHGEEDFLVNLAQEETVVTGDELDAEAVKNRLLEGKVGYFLADTSEYQDIQSNMAGMYKVILLQDMPLEGRFTNLWSVWEGAPRAEKKAGVRLLYFLLSKENQYTFDLQYDRGLPLHREIFQQYESMDTEFTGLNRSVERLTPKRTANR